MLSKSGWERESVLLTIKKSNLDINWFVLNKRV
jgi:hypothetical protein